MSVTEEIILINHTDSRDASFNEGEM